MTYHENYPFFFLFFFFIGFHQNFSLTGTIGLPYRQVSNVEMYRDKLKQLEQWFKGLKDFKKRVLHSCKRSFPRWGRTRYVTEYINLSCCRNNDSAWFNFKRGKHLGTNSVKTGICTEVTLLWFYLCWSTDITVASQWESQTHMSQRVPTEPESSAVVKKTSTY